MARIEVAAAVTEDFDRILAHLEEQEAEDSEASIRGIIAAIDVLEHCPSIGRKVKRGTRELAVGRGARGYLVLYRYVAALDAVFVLAVRAQREAGYSRE